MITGPQLRAVRFSIGWEPKMLVVRAQVPLTVVMRAESSTGEPIVTIVRHRPGGCGIKYRGCRFHHPPTYRDLDLRARQLRSIPR